MAERDFGTTYRIPAKCAGCGVAHQVQSFAPPEPDAEPVPAKCDVCLTADEEAAAKRHHPAVPMGGKRAQKRSKKLAEEQLDEVRQRAEKGQRTQEDGGEWWNR